MEQLSLTPATQAVLDALTALGQATVPDLADRSGKARSTTDKAIKTLADAGVIKPVDTDPVDGEPVRWTLTTPTDADTAPTDIEPGDEQTMAPDGAEHPDPTADTETGGPDGELASPPGEPIDSDVDDGPDGDEVSHAEDDAAPDTTTTEPIGADESTDENDLNDGDLTDEGDRTDSRDGSEGDAGTNTEAEPVAVVQPARPGDRKVMAIKGVLADHGDDGATLEQIVAESGIGHATATRLLTAMEQADAARQLPGLPQRWIPGPTKASEVDPNPEPPRCPLCTQVIRAAAATPSATSAVQPLIRPDGTLHIVDPAGDIHVVTLPTRTTPRTASTGRSTTRLGDGSVNNDGNPPFARGELERLTLDYLAAHPGQQMTPQDITTALAAQLGRAVSNGAVRNNLTKAAAAGRILLVADAPLTFVHPTPPETDTTGQDGDTAQS